jgi:hypothetical protein
MPDVFTRLPTRLAGVFSADSASLSFGGGISTALVQNVNSTYMQAITRLYEVGGDGQSTAVYYVGGRSQGSLAIARVIGPTSLIGAYYTTYGNVCNAPRNILRLDFTTGCDGANQRASYTFKFCVITTIGTAIAAMDMVVNESSQLMFTGMEYQGP